MSVGQCCIRGRVPGGAEGSRAPPFLVVEWKLLQVCYAFWPYRFPEAYGPTAPPAALVAKFGGVIDRYLEFLDHELGSLLAAYPATVNVMIVADHGHTATLDHQLWRGWHDRDALFVAAGPDFPHREAPIAVSYFDIVPTIVDVLGFPLPEGLHGTSLRGR